jgi:hypothetical protein
MTSTSLKSPISGTLISMVRIVYSVILDYPNLLQRRMNREDSGDVAHLGKLTPA